MTEKKYWDCEICTKQFKGNTADAHVEIFLNTINRRDTGYIEQYYSEIVRLGMCYDCIKKGLAIWQLPKILERINALQSGEQIHEDTT